MSLNLNPYLSFRGNAREALEFYRSVLGGKLDVMRYDSIPGMMGDESEADKIMHGYLETPEGLALMAADIPQSMPDAADSSTGGSAVCIWGDDEERMLALWDGLTEGGRVNLPFDPAPWGGRFGDLTDRFGVRWMLNLGTDQAAA